MFKNNGWEVSGIEPNKTAREIAKNKNRIETFDIDHISQFNAGQFDVISMWHVLEHIYEIDFQIQQIRRILKDDGILIIAVPNSESFDAQIYKQYWAAYDVPRHLYHFNQKSVAELLMRYNFEHVKTEPMKFDAYYISMMSEKYKNGNISYIKAFFNGMWSNMKASKEKNYSSLIYIFKKEA